MHLSHILQYTTLEQKCAHICSNVVYYRMWDRCIVGFVSLHIGEESQIPHVPYTVKCRYNTAQFIEILHTALHLQQQNIDKNWNSQQTPHTSP